MKTPVSRVVSSTPAVERTIPGVSTGFYIGVFGVHPSGEKDDAQCHHSDELRVRGTVEL